MLDEEVRTSDLSIKVLLIGDPVLAEISCVILAHIVFECFTVCVRRRLPS